MNPRRFANGTDGTDALFLLVNNREGKKKDGREGLYKEELGSLRPPRPDVRNNRRKATSSMLLRAKKTNFIRFKFLFRRKITNGN